MFKYKIEKLYILTNWYLGLSNGDRFVDKQKLCTLKRPPDGKAVRGVELYYDLEMICLKFDQGHGLIMIMILCVEFFCFRDLNVTSSMH